MSEPPKDLGYDETLVSGDSGRKREDDASGNEAAVFAQTLPSPVTPASSLSELVAGQRIGRYEIIHPLGRGAMGTVYAAYDPQLDREVALKVLHRNSADATGRFAREAKALAKLDHPNVVGVYDSGDHLGRFYLVMQLVDGVALDDYLTTRKPSVAQCLRVFVDAGRGLAAAHASGLVHRDFKPANVIVDRNGRVAVTDFGLAISSDATEVEPVAVAEQPTSSPSIISHRQARSSSSVSQQRLTRVGALVGTPAYMAPEQHNGQVATAASDQYAFATALWEALYLRHPFISDEVGRTGSIIACSVAVLSHEFQPVDPARPVPASLERALRRALAEDPGARWPSMPALLHAIAPPVKARKWPWLVAALVLAAAAATATWMLRAPAAGPTCGSRAEARFASAWSDEDSNALATRWVATGRSYADLASKQVQAVLQPYRDHWVRAETNRCEADRGDNAPLAIARTTCLDRAQTNAGQLRRYLLETDATTTVSKAVELMGTLRPLSECDNAEALLGGLLPPAENAGDIAQLETRVATARLDLAAGKYRDVSTTLQTLTPDVQRWSWAPLIVEVALIEADVAAQQNKSATKTLVAALELATQHNLERGSADLWISLLMSAALDRNSELLQIAARLSVASARRLHDPDLELQALTSTGLAENRIDANSEGLRTCQAAKEFSLRVDLSSDNARRLARCFLAVYTSMQLNGDLATLLKVEMETVRQTYGAEHPAFADYLIARSGLYLNTSDFKQANRDAVDAHAIYQASFGDDHFKTLLARNQQAQVGFWQGRYAEATEISQDLLTRAAADDPTMLYVRLQAEAMLGNIAAYRQPPNLDTAVAHYRRAIAASVAYYGNDSRKTALLKLTGGQYLSGLNFDAGAALIREAIDVFGRIHSPMEAVATGALGMMTLNEERPAEALPLLERALEISDLENLEPSNRGRMRFALARALSELKVAPARQREIAELALEDFIETGAAEADNATRIKKFLKQLPSRKR